MKQPSVVIIPFANKFDDTKYVKGTISGTNMDRASEGYSRNEDLILEKEPADAFRKWYRGPYASFISEPSATNYYRYSSEFTNGVHSKTGTVAVSEDTEVAPNGKLDADKLMPSTEASSQRYIQQNIDLSSGDHTFSVYLKYKGERKVRLLYAQNSSPFTVFGVATYDLIDGVTSSVTGVSANMEYYGNGWWKASITGTSTVTGSHLFRVLLGDSSPESGSIEDCVLLWGGQVETGLYSTSQIPTDSSTAVREADEITFTIDPISDSINNHFSAYFNLNFTNTGDELSMFTFTDGTVANRIQIRSRPDGTSVRFMVWIDNELFSHIEDVGGYDEDVKIMFTFLDNNLNIYVNGENVASNSYTNISFSGNLDKIINSNISGTDDTNRFVGLINEIMLFPMTLTDAESNYITSR